MEADADRYEELLQAHLNVNPKSWAALASRGVDEQTPLRLDFQFTAPGEEQVRALMKHLREATDYEFKGGARDQQDGTRRWLVLGTTSPSTWSLERLNAWVAEMTIHGRDHGPAEFDGWGATAAESRAQASARAVGVLSRRLRRRP